MILEAMDLGVRFGNKIVLQNTNINVEQGEVVSIIGPNGSGKSTLIKVLSRCLKPYSGIVKFDGVNIYDIPTKSLARQIAILPQIKTVSTDITVESLVTYGRYPHLGFGKRVGNEDKEIINWALDKTKLLKLKDRYVSTLSGGESQRAWIAMALAQKTNILILDEPTTYLDVSYQLETLELIKDLNKALGLTIVMVLHDLNHAARYSDTIYVLLDGTVWTQGKPQDIIKSTLLKDVFRIKAHVYEDKVNDTPYFIPHKIAE